jgi:hypothetical protein
MMGTVMFEIVTLRHKHEIVIRSAVVTGENYLDVRKCMCICCINDVRIHNSNIMNG